MDCLNTPDQCSAHACSQRKGGGACEGEGAHCWREQPLRALAVEIPLQPHNEPYPRLQQLAFGEVAHGWKLQDILLVIQGKSIAADARHPKPEICSITAGEQTLKRPVRWLLALQLPYYPTKTHLHARASGHARLGQVVARRRALQGLAACAFGRLLHVRGAAAVFEFGGELGRGRPLRHASRPGRLGRGEGRGATPVAAACGTNMRASRSC